MIKYIFAVAALLLCGFAFASVALHLTTSWGGFLLAAFIAAFFTCVAADHDW